MNCPACGNENSEDVQFCRGCGTSLSVPAGIGVEAVRDNSIRYHGLDALRGMAMLLGVSDDYYLLLEENTQPEDDLLRRICGLFNWNYNEVLQKLRLSSEIPVIFLTSKDDEIDQLLGLKMGADDYITKPFSQKLLIERVKTILKRVSKISDPNSLSEDNFLKRGDLNLNISRHECIWREIQIKLTVTEFLILENLVNRPGYVKSRDQLMSAAYDDNIYVDDRTIDSHIKRIRRKFKSKDKNFDSIETLYGVGYRFNQ